MQTSKSTTVPIEEVETDLRHHIALVEAGATVHISSDGKTIAELRLPPRRAGGLKS